jgi:hypothetical protein
MFKPSQGVIHVNDEDLAHSAANPRVLSGQ